MKNIHFGCGSIIMKNWINIDRYSNKADIKISNFKLPFKEKEIDNIYTSHTIEHINKFEFSKMLFEWYRVLKFNGKLIIRCPNATYHMNKWLDGNVEWKMDKGLNCILGLQFEEEKLGMINRNLFTIETLSKYLEKVNFKIENIKLTTIRDDFWRKQILNGIVDDGEKRKGDLCDIFCIASKDKK